MTLPVAERTVAYAGLVTVLFHTYTTTYTPIQAGWDWVTSSPEPMEFHGYQKSGVPIGMQANIFNVAHGITNMSVGNTNIANIANAANWGTYPVVQGGQVTGFCAGKVGDTNFYSFAYPYIPGTNYSRSVFSLAQSKRLSTTIPNTFYGVPGAGGNFPMAGGAVAGNYYVNLNPFWISETNGGMSAGVGLDLGVSNLMHLLAGLTSFGTNYVRTGNPADNTDRRQLLTTDFVSGGTYYNLHFENPPGGYDMDTFMVLSGNVPMPTNGGWTQVSKDVTTIEGQPCNGFVVLVSPDYTYYKVLRLIPGDSTSSTWYTQIGGNTSKIDQNGALWLKNVNSDSTIFVSAGNVLKVLPIFPPIPIPDNTDTDPVLLMMRSK